MGWKIGMRKKILKILLILNVILALGIRMYNMEQRVRLHNRRISVRVYSVDDSLYQGGYVAKNGEDYVYVNSGYIYISQNGEQPRRLIQYEGEIEYIGLNNKYVVYCIYDYGSYSAYNVDIESKEVKSLGSFVTGINSYDDKMYIVDRWGNVFDVSTPDVKEVEGKNYDDRYEGMFLYKDTPVYERDSQEVYINIGKSLYYFYISQLYIDGVKNKSFSNNILWRGFLICPSHVALIDDDIYILYQGYGAAGKLIINPDYNHKDGDCLLRYNVKSGETEVLYHSDDAKEQVTGFSVKNNELYLLRKGILYRTDLNGRNRVELGNYIGHTCLTFEYMNDELIVYDENQNMLATY